MDTILSKYGEYFLTVIALALLFGPVIHYFLRGWVDRRREILGSFSEKNIKKYFEIFFFANLGTSENPQQTFANLYHRRFGRQHFIIPMVCLFVVSSFLLILVSRTAFLWLREKSDLQSGLPPIAVAAVAGAYMWVLHDFIRRVQSRDLVPTNVFWASFRLLIAAPLGFAIATLFNEEIGVAVAVLLGAFPTRSLFTISRRIAQQRLSVGDVGKETSYELKNLQGIGISQAERFEDEGVVTILQLAYSDPIDLTIRTNFSFSYVVDCCSQALAWLYFQQELPKMRRYSLRGGQEIQSLISEIDGDNNVSPQEQKQAEKCRHIVATELKMNPEAFERTLREIGEDPYTDFLCNIWCEQ